MLPSKVAVGKGGNPLLQLDGLEQPASIVVAYFVSTPAHEAVAKISPTAQFTVRRDDTIIGPVIAVSVEDASPEAAIAVLKHLVAELPKQLKLLQRQVQARSDSYMWSTTLGVDAVAKKNISATRRLMVVAFILGVIGTIMATLAADTFLQGRKERRAGKGPADPGPDDHEPIDRLPDADSTLGNSPEGVGDSSAVRSTSSRRTRRGGARQVDDERTVGEQVVAGSS